MLGRLAPTRLMRRAAPALLLAGASLLGGAARAEDQAVAAAATPRDAKSWLARIYEATGRRNFQGTFVVSSGGSVASARIVHFCDGRNQYERIESLDGQKRQVYRHNDLVTTFWPHRRLALVETRRAKNEFPALLSSGVERIAEHYDIQPVGDGRVAGREAHVLRLHPRDRYRYGYRLWAEQRSGLLLRAEVLDEHESVLEAAAFSDLMIGVKPRPELILQAMQRTDGYTVQRPALEPASLEREGWSFGALPAGFAPVSSVKRTLASPDEGPDHAASGPRGDDEHPVLQTIYSDGLTYVSVFIEPYDASRHRREMQMAMGATHTMARRQGDWWLTVIGDVPPVTLRAFAAALERRP